jgi:hypothetical protein
LIFREKTIKIKLLWNGRKNSSYLNGMPGVQFTGNQDTTRRMSSDYDLIRKRASEDSGTAGDQGEEHWRKLFKQWLPPAYHVVTKGRLLSAIVSFSRFQLR